MPRTILIHLNVEAPKTDERTPDDLADAILGAIIGTGPTREARPLGGSLAGVVIICPLAEEV